MRHIIRTVLPIILILASPVFVFAADESEIRLITVTGDAEVTVSFGLK
jgi:hypothetical protein